MFGYEGSIKNQYWIESIPEIEITIVAVRGKEKEIDRGIISGNLVKII